jgi:nitrogen fixation protein FixH
MEELIWFIVIISGIIGFFAIIIAIFRLITTGSLEHKQKVVIQNTYNIPHKFKK